ncbi:MAG: hypothetical protein ABSH22_10200 [Tepidisphaeraceae bacterium]
MIRLINPNYHVILIHYPLALLGLGLLIEMFGFLWSTSSVRVAGRWMILIGALASIPAATSGIFAKFDVMQQMAGGGGGPWADVRSAAKLTALQMQLLNRHVLFAGFGTALATLAAIAYLGSSPHFPDRVGFPLMAAFLASMALMTFGAYNAGEIISRTQFSTKSQDQAEKLEADYHAQVAAAEPKDRAELELEYYVDTMQTHLIAAGIFFALLAAALGFSLQKSKQLHQPRPRAREEDQPYDEATAIQVAPAALFWSVAVLAGLGTLAVGWYVFAHDLETPLWNVRAAFQSAIWAPYRKDPANGARTLVHLLLGGGIIALGALLIPAARWRAKNPMLIGVVGLIIMAAIAAQIWIGVLMMYDMDSGPLTRFNPSAEVAAQVGH